MSTNYVNAGKVLSGHCGKNLQPIRAMLVKIARAKHCDIPEGDAGSCAGWSESLGKILYKATFTCETTKIPAKLHGCKGDQGECCSKPCGGCPSSYACKSVCYDMATGECMECPDDFICADDLSILADIATVNNNDSLAEVIAELQAICEKLLNLVKEEYHSYLISKCKKIEGWNEETTSTDNPTGELEIAEYELLNGDDVNTPTEWSYGTNSTTLKLDHQLDNAPTSIQAMYDAMEACIASDGSVRLEIVDRNTGAVTPIIVTAFGGNNDVGQTSWTISSGASTPQAGKILSAKAICVSELDGQEEVTCVYGWLCLPKCVAWQLVQLPEAQEGDWLQLPQGKWVVASTGGEPCPIGEARLSSFCDSVQVRTNNPAGFGLSIDGADPTPLDASMFSQVCPQCTPEYKSVLTTEPLVLEDDEQAGGCTAPTNIDNSTTNNAVQVIQPKESEIEPYEPPPCEGCE